VRVVTLFHSVVYRIGCLLRRAPRSPFLPYVFLLLPFFQWPSFLTTLLLAVPPLTAFFVRSRSSLPRRWWTSLLSTSLTCMSCFLSFYVRSFPWCVAQSFSLFSPRRLLLEPVFFPPLGPRFCFFYTPLSFFFPLVIVRTLCLAPFCCPCLVS